MNNSPNKRDKRVGDVLAYACQYWAPKRRGRKRELSDEDRKAMKRRITRYFKEERGMSAPYLVTDRQMRAIVTIDLRDYFEERLGDEEDVIERKQLRKQASGLIEKERERILTFYEAQREDREVSYEITSDGFQKLMIRAMFRKMFPTFDEATFKDDYKKLSYLTSELPLWSMNLDGEDAVEFLQLKKRIDPALTNGDISAYESDEGLHQETVKSHG
jgi:hypothetical protein